MLLDLNVTNIETMIDGGQGFHREGDGRWVEIMRPATTGEAMSILNMATERNPVMVLVPNGGKPYWASVGELGGLY